MLRMLLLSVIFLSCLPTTSAQIIDSLPYLKLPDRISAFEDIVGPLSRQQSSQIANRMLEMNDRVRTANNRNAILQERQQLRRSIESLLTERQKANLNAKPENERTTMGGLLRDYPPRPRRRQ